MPEVEPLSLQGSKYINYSYTQFGAGCKVYVNITYFGLCGSTQGVVLPGPFSSAQPRFASALLLPLLLLLPV